VSVAAALPSIHEPDRISINSFKWGTMSQGYISFPEDFVFGCASASYQIEGAWNEDGKGESIWDRFCHTPGNVKNNEHGDIACDHYHRYSEDMALMKQLGLEAYRFSLSWPRILPLGKGAINSSGLDFYDRLIDELCASGIQPWVTLFHWDMPQVLWERHRGWLNRDMACYFRDYAQIAYDRFGDRVKHWMTLNEPINVHINLGYNHGMFPPKFRGTLKEVHEARHVILLAHGLAVQAFRESGREGQIGMAPAPSITTPLTDSPEDRAAAQAALDYTVHWMLDPVLKQRYPDVTYAEEMKPHLPEIRQGDLETIGTPVDFMGINQYRRHYVQAAPDQVLGFRSVSDEEAPAEERNGLQWPINPHGMYETLMHIHRRYPEYPLVITENGYTASLAYDQEPEVHDPYRISFMRRYLAQIHRAIGEGAPVKGYFYWSFTDNFEWVEGYTPRFGLIGMHYPTQRRVIKDSGRWYKELIEKRGFSQE
jgi:beta-glucosidase